MRDRDRYVREIYLGGQWVTYPIQVAILKPITMIFSLSSADIFQENRDDPRVKVWIGPPAFFPAKVEMPAPRQVTTFVLTEDLQYPGWRDWYASKVPGIAWLYELFPSDQDPDFHWAIWKVWDQEDLPS